MWWDVFGHAVVGEAQDPFVFVDEAVMEGADEDAVGEVGRSAAAPGVAAVMGIAPVAVKVINDYGDDVMTAFEVRSS